MTDLAPAPDNSDGADRTSLEASSSDPAAIPAALQRDWILLALVAAASRFVPVPLLDDVVKTQANRGAVKRAITESGREVNIALVTALYDTGSILGFLVALPLKVILYPLRKIARVISAVHGVPTDLLETLLLGRSVFRALKRGAFDNSEDVKAMKAEAKHMRWAFEQAFKGTNFKVISSALGDALSRMKDLSGIVSDITGQLLGNKSSGTGAKVDDDAIDQADLSEVAERDDVEEGLDDVEEVLARADVIKELEAFDARFDEALARKDR